MGSKKPFRAIKDLTGQRFGRLIVLYRDENKQVYKRSYWICQCDCGNLKSVRSDSLTGGVINSCNCILKEKVTERAKVLNLTHGRSKTPLYRLWKHMTQRCYNPTDASYKNYGGRGITVCEDWRSNFEAFETWALITGYVYNQGLSIDRIDNNDNYCPENCRWANKLQQNRNTRFTLRITHEGVEYAFNDFVELMGIVSCQTAHSRVKYGWPKYEAATYPKGKPYFSKSSKGKRTPI